MSDLDYPISVLIAERKEIASSLQRHGDDITKKRERMYDLNKAIGILNDVIRKDELEKREKKEEAIPYTKKL